MAGTISKSKLKAKMLERFRQPESSGDELIITDRGKPVLKIVPIQRKTVVATLFEGCKAALRTWKISTPPLCRNGKRHKWTSRHFRFALLDVGSCPTLLQGQPGD
jgi:antitoxin (DNA-binding transcriptional repressor) of toxin-antitoxin stability system